MKRLRILVLAVLLLPLLLLMISVAATRMREDKTPEQAAPPAGRFIQTRDAKVFISQQGPVHGPSIVLLHGTGAWGEIWRATTDALVAQGFRVLTIDAPPFGFSQKLTDASTYSVGKQADRLLDVLATLHIDRTVVVCHSVGCRAALEAVLKHPQIAQRLILADPALGFADDRAHLHFEQKHPAFAARAYFASRTIRDAITGLYGTSPYSIRPLFRSFVSNKAAVTEERVAMLQQPLALRGMTQAEGDWLENLVTQPEYGRFTDFAAYRTLPMPVLILWGQDDTITPLWQGEALQLLFADAKLSAIPQCGHIPYIEQTAEFNRRLLDFLSLAQ